MASFKTAGLSPSRMWIPLTLLSAVGAAGTGLALKQALNGGGLMASTVAYRAAGGILLLALVAVAGLGVPLGRSTRSRRRS